MAMGIVSDSDFDSELETLNKKNQSLIVQIERGRGHQLEVPESLRKIIGENAVEEGSKETRTLTRALGISDSSLSAYKQGATSTASYHNPTFKDHIDKARAKITKRASHKLNLALHHITDEKLAIEKPRDLAGIAKDMSVIIKNLEPESETHNQISGPTFMIYAPQMVSEEKFEIIDLKE